MTVSQEYKEIFEKEILQKGKGVIFSYSPVEDAYKYQPYSHAVGRNAVEDLAALISEKCLPRSPYPRSAGNGYIHPGG